MHDPPSLRRPSIRRSTHGGSFTPSFHPPAVTLLPQDVAEPSFFPSLPQQTLESEPASFPSFCLAPLGEYVPVVDMLVAVPVEQRVVFGHTLVHGQDVPIAVPLEQRVLLGRTRGRYQRQWEVQPVQVTVRFEPRQCAVSAHKAFGVKQLRIQGREVLNE